MIQNCSQKATIGYQMGKTASKVDLGARVDFLSKVLETFWKHFLPKSRSKIDAKTDVEKT